MSKHVNKPSAEFEQMHKALVQHRALWGGTQAMRDAGDKFLPRFEAEDEKEYRARLNRSFLFNAYKKTIRDMRGRVFRKPAALVGPNERLQMWAEDVDLQGRALTNFAGEVFQDAIMAGVSYILVDAPRRDGVVTVAQAQAEGLRPYFVHLPAEHVLGIQTAYVGNRSVVSQLRFIEIVSEQDLEDEFKEVAVAQIRVMNRMDVMGEGQGVLVRLFRLIDEKSGEWAEVDRYTIDVPEIRLVPVYANRTGFMMGEPLLQDLADANIAHWQSDSDQRHILHVARVPILWGAGWDDDSVITVGASTAHITSHENAKLEFAEHSGAAIGAGREDLKDLEFRMQMLGLQLVVQRNDGGATGAALDAEKETSQLGLLADNLEDALQQAVDWMADFGGIDTAEVAVNKEFVSLGLTAQDFTAMLQAVNTGQMSRETFLEVLKRRGWLDDGFDVDGELERLDEGEMPEPQMMPGQPVQDAAE